MSLVHYSNVLYDLLMTKILRVQELQSLSRFCATSDSGFTFLRGRRRVGKTWLLRDFQANTPNCFYFMGLEDADDEGTRRHLAESWHEFSRDSTLVELNQSFRTWQRIFQQITSYASKLDRPLIILLDEVQWIAKKNSGFISMLKQAWVDWQRLGKVKVIVCGSSNKFFAKQTTGADDVLRGIKTAASIWVNELSLAEIEKYYLANWSRSEICLTYMMLGGSPYYLEPIKPEKGFIHAINDAIFTKDSLFLEEVGQVLKLEFNSSGVASAKKILSALGQAGASFSTIAKKTAMPASTLSHAIDNLLEYELIFQREMFGQPAGGGKQSPIYYMRDFYLNFYFQVLDKFVSLIKNNVDQLIFTSKAFLGHSGFYMPDFSGQAFELLCHRLLLRKDLAIPMRHKLALKTLDYQVGSYRDQAQQIDLIVEDSSDRITRLIECKWTDGNSKLAEHVAQVKKQNYPIPTNYGLRRYLLPSYQVKAAKATELAQEGVNVLSLDDLFEPV